VVLVMSPEGRAAGFILSSPEQGNVILNWSYLLPEYRKGLLALVAMKAYVKLWQHKRFHKIIAFTKTDNRAPQLIMQRSGYQTPILLREHLFGVDFLMYEYFLNKTEAGFHRSVQVGLKGRIIGRLRAILS
jgi:RimJ/RimL family protein N-acetyltransferase